MKASKTLFMVAGEQSGDLHGAALVRELREVNPGLNITGIPGPAMRGEGVSGILQVEDFSVMGFADVILSLPKLVRQFFLVRNRILETQPDGVVFIDYPGFNIRLARSLRKKGYDGKLVQYISPSVWAHGKGRIKHMERDLDHLLTIFPFESDYFAETKLPVTFTGNPLYDAVESTSIPHAVGDPNLIGIFPGSRLSEIKQNLPLQLEAAALFAENHPQARFAVSIAHDRMRELIEGLVQISPIKEKTTFYDPASAYRLMQTCGYALATSGTVTLELALHRRPAVVTFVVTPFNSLILRTIVRPSLDHYCIVNIIANQRVFPEWMEEAPTPQRIAGSLESLYQDPSATLAGCDAIRSLLKTPHPAAKTAALKIEELLR